MIKSMTKKMNNKKGFTLIELIVVIAILGILAAIAIPRFSGVRASANQSAAITVVTNIQRAAEMAAAELNVEITGVPTADVERLLGDTVASFNANPAGATYAWTQADGLASVSGITVAGNLGAAFDYDDVKN